MYVILVRLLHVNCAQLAIILTKQRAVEKISPTKSAFYFSRILAEKKGSPHVLLAKDLRNIHSAMFQR